MINTISPYLIYGSVANNTSWYEAVEVIYDFCFDLAFLISIGFILIMVAVILFVIKGIALYKISKNLNINNRELCFVPLCSPIIFGKVAENFYKTKGLKSAKFSIILPILKILQVFTRVLFLIFTISSASKIYDFAYQAIIEDTAMTIEMFSSVIWVVIFFCVCLAISIAHMIIYFVAFYRICNIFDEKKATIFTIVSVFLPFLAPIFLLVLSKNEPKSEE